MAIVSQLADLGVAAAGIFAAGWALAKWVRRPTFICGIPPSIEERGEGFDRRRLGHDSVATAFKHEPYCFAERLPKPHREKLSADYRHRLLTDPERARRIVADEDRRAQVPVLIANTGMRVANYSATITFYSRRSKVHVIDVVTETAPVYLYAGHPELVADRARVPCADERIVAGYEKYMMDDRMEWWGDVVILRTGSHLEAGLFELVIVEVEFEADISDFFVVFSVDCTDGWIGAQTFIQGCSVVPGRAESPLVEAAAGAK